MTTNIYLFTSPSCPHCPAAKDSLERVSKEREDIIVSFLELPDPKAQEMARHFGVQSVPTFVMQEGDNEPIGLSGSQSTETLHKYIDRVQGKEEVKKDSATKRFFKKLGIEIN